MEQHWCKKPKALIFMSLIMALLFIVACGTAEQPDTSGSSPAMPAGQDQANAPSSGAPTAAPMPTEVPVSPGGGKLGRLIIGISPIGYDTNYSYKVTSSGLLDKRPVIEWLIGTDSISGAYVPQLAESWEMAPNGKDWTVSLRKGVQWHDGWGEFTARDVHHSLWLLVHPESSASNVGAWRLMAGVEKGESAEAITEKVNERIEIVDDYTVKFHGVKVEPELDLLMSYRRNWLIESKARWDEVGPEGYGEAIVGTGPLKFVERIEGVRVAYEAIDDHWRVSPDYQELEFRWVPEAATRLATLLTEEVHLSDVERAARAEATNKGMQIIPSAATGMQVRGLFGGQYYTEPEKMQAGNPLHEKKVRQALNKAINRQAIADVLLSGSEVLIPHLFPFHRTLDEALWPGIFNQEWLGRWDEMYGYDPEQARVLLAEAGYPEGFEVTFYLFPLPGLPEMPDIGQAIALDWEAIGVKPKLVNLEFPKVREKYRSQSLQTEIYLVRGGNPTLTYIPAYFLTKSTAHGYQKPELDALWDELGRTLAREDRAQVFQQMGDILYDEFGLIQLFALSSEIMVNPQYIAEYKFPGDISGFFTHLEQIKTVPQ